MPSSVIPSSSIPQQLTIAVDRPHQQRLDNFVVGDNEELVDSLRAQASQQRQFQGLWIFGPEYSGRTHLLRGKCLLSIERDLTPVSYVGCDEFAGDEAGLLQALGSAGESDRVVCVDDVATLSGVPAFEEALMAVYQRVFSQQGMLLVSHSKPATALEFGLPDLNSRLRSMLHYQLNPMTDEDKVKLLGKRAQARGYELNRNVLAYWMARGPRDVGTLLKDLDVLDRASLARHQPVTISLLKQVLGY